MTEINPVPVLFATAFNVFAFAFAPTLVLVLVLENEHLEHRIE
ncbi:hypothetical protein ACFQMM_13530 [Saliphagus sp. GCM10025308]